jgi:hypothetical protein
MKKVYISNNKNTLLHTCEFYASLMYSTIYCTMAQNLSILKGSASRDFQLLLILSKTSNTVKHYYWINFNVLQTHLALRDLETPVYKPSESRTWR